MSGRELQTTYRCAQWLWSLCLIVMLIFPFLLRWQGSRPRCPTLRAVPSHLACLHSFSSRFDSVVSDYLQPHGLQNSRLPCPEPTTEACANPYPSSWWCHPTISSSVVPFSSCPQSSPESGSFPRSQFFPSGGQSIRDSASASVLPVNIQGWFPLGLTGFILDIKIKLELIYMEHQNYW